MNSLLKQSLVIFGILGISILIIVLVANLSDKKSGANIKLSNLEGQKAPEFSLKDNQGKEYNNQNLQGKKVVLFFSEGIACYPACWDQINAFGKDDRFNKDDVIVLSVVNDRPSDWKDAAQKMPDIAKANLVFDESTQVSRDFGMLTVPSSMRPGKPGHSYVIIGKDGIIKYTYDDPRMAINNDQIFKEIQKLN